MHSVPDIRDLSRRAELEFHVRRHPHRRRDWMLGLICGTLCLVFAAAATMRGHYSVYWGGSLSDSHAFIASNCRQCHTSWKPAQRLVDVTLDVDSVEYSSIDNQACLKCHAASEHHSNQIPAHSELSCAACHREHRGRKVLAQVTDLHCIRCHADLKSTEDSTKFARHVTGFDEAHGHPEFHLWRRLESHAPNEIESFLISQQEQDDHALHPKNGPIGNSLRDVLKPLKPGELGVKNSDSGLRDRTELKFNHAVHFQTGHIFDRNGRQEDLVKNCQACHTTDIAGRAMLPVNYEAHCARCHALFYDNANHPGDEVPHERLELVRGFLTEKYTLAALKSNAPDLPAADQPPRPLPGSAIRGPMQATQAADVEQRVASAEKYVLEHTRQQLQGGCKLCHTLERPSPGGLVKIVPPDQPERWLPQSRFDHAAHRTFDCLQCHSDVSGSRPEHESTKSQSAADVLIPKIADCQSCHVSAAARPRVIKAESTHQTFEVISTCVKCHVYHRRD
ncbi:MAG: Doubled motif protein [Planctomycetaceae bacterium]|nr:Doubled motif protein [Planctomycetaceae bacterium]